MMEAAFSANSPLKFQHPMFFDAVPHISRPKYIPAIRIEGHIQMWFRLGGIRRFIVVEPVFDLLAAEQMLRIRDLAVLVFRWQLNVAHARAAASLIKIGRPITKEVTSQQIHPFIEPGEFLN